MIIPTDTVGGYVYKEFFKPYLSSSLDKSTESHTRRVNKIDQIVIFNNFILKT